MRAIALSFADSDFTTPGTYREYLHEKLASLATARDEKLVVLPAHTALMLAYYFGELGDVQTIDEAITLFKTLPASWHVMWLQLQQSIASELGTWLVPGTSLCTKDNQIFHEALLLTPHGEIAGRQKQLFLSRKEREWGLSRGEILDVFKTPLGQIGIIIGTDAWYPETGRILALQGAEIVCCCGALPAGNNDYLQQAGMWAQVQQNQFFCVESQLSAEIAGHFLGAQTIIHAPCEMTDGFTGVLASGGQEGLPVSANLDHAARRKVITGYPLLKFLQPAAYQPLVTAQGGQQ